MIQVLFLEHYTKLVLFCEFSPCLSGGPRAPVPDVHGLRGDVEGLRHRSGGDGVPSLLGCSAPPCTERALPPCREGPPWSPERELPPCPELAEGAVGEARS